ncbi:MAG: carboxymuconolactone decarboxylase family protein [Clostridiales bacterium]|nr:carboxymuconolactone decarboxylase family protein [Clostridiales bacterium]
MNINSMYHWQLMDEINPECRKAFQELSRQTNRNEVLPPKYRELIVFGMACVLRSAPAVYTHGRTAMERYGATKEELFAVMAASMTLGGVPAYREASLVLEEFLKGN